MPNLLLGQTLGNRYQFEELLGEGTFARVYRVLDLRRRAMLAAKALRQDIAPDPAFLERFRREAAVLERLQHPNIVRYYDTIEVDHAIFILMDYIPGQTLETVLTGAPLKPHAMLTTITPLASALHFAHMEGVIHRDLKPANILIHENGTLYVTDFSIARILNAASELTAGITIGTPFYMAPEQITGAPVSFATDIYALGILLYRMVTGQLPFRGERPDAVGETVSERVTYEQVHAQPEPPVYLNPDLDLAVQEIVLRCLEKDPLRRFSSMSSLYDALAEAVGAPPMSLLPASDDSGAAPQPPDLKLPEWSQYMPPVPAVDNESHSPDDEDTAPPLTVDKIEHPVPLPETEPHLEKSLRPRAPRSMPTLPSWRRPAPREQDPSYRYPSPSAPVYGAPASAPPPVLPAAHRRPKPRRWTMIALALGALVVVAALCAAFVYLLQSSGGNNPTPLPQDSTLPPTPTDVSPATTPISRGGTRIAFDSERNGNPDIFIMNTDGSDLHQLTGSSGAERGPSWSPDGAQIAFYGAAAENGAYDIFVMNVDGTGLRNLTNTPTINERYPTWSPNGAQLAFHGNADGDYDLYLINSDGTGLRPITDNTADDLGPDWSPEGTQIAFHTDLWGAPYQIALLDLATLQIRRLTDNDNTNSFPAWSPDGAQIAYHSISSLNESINIYLLRLDGSPASQLTNTPANNAFPDWSPDGTQIIYQSGQPGVSAIFVIPAVGGTPQALTGVQGNFLPEWEPLH